MVEYYGLFKPLILVNHFSSSSVYEESLCKRRKINAHTLTVMGNEYLYSLKKKCCTYSEVFL